VRAIVNRTLTVANMTAPSGLTFVLFLPVLHAVLRDYRTHGLPLTARRKEGEEGGEEKTRQRAALS